MKLRMKEYPIVLCIAGSEPLGSAGVQADIKSVSACGAYAAGALTCIVNEDTRTIKEVFPLPARLAVGQAESVLSDVGAASVKTGMLFTAELIGMVADLLERYPSVPAVVDPVMVNTRGIRLIEEDAVQAYRLRLIPRATVITPNYHEACLLSGRTFGPDEADTVLRALSCGGRVSVVVKSVPDGPEHLTDFFLDAAADRIRPYRKVRVDTRNLNGTGCSFSSSIAAFLARGFSLPEAVDRAEDYITGAIRAGAEYTFGHDFGPVDHFYRGVR